LGLSREEESDTRRRQADVDPSSYHWGLVGNARKLAVGEWQISRVYADLKQADPSLLFAKSSLESVMRNNLSDLLPSAYEGMPERMRLRNSLNWLEITSRRRASNWNLSETKRMRRFTLTRLTKPNLYYTRSKPKLSSVYAVQEWM